MKRRLYSTVPRLCHALRSALRRLRSDIGSDTSSQNTFSESQTVQFSSVQDVMMYDLRAREQQPPLPPLPPRSSPSPSFYEWSVLSHELLRDQIVPNMSARHLRTLSSTSSSETRYMRIRRTLPLVKTSGTGQSRDAL